MGRVVLLALLGIPIMVATHAAGVMFSTVDQTALRVQWQPRGHSPQQATPSWFVVEQTVDRRA